MTIYGSEAVATVGEVVSGFVFQPLPSKVIQIGAGAVVGLIASLHPEMPDRGRKELMEISSHLVSRLVDPSPQQIRELKRNAEELIAAIKSMDAGRIIEATLRSPIEIQQTIQEFKEMVGLESTEFVGGTKFGEFENFGSETGTEFETAGTEFETEKPIEIKGVMY